MFRFEDNFIEKTFQKINFLLNVNKKKIIFGSLCWCLAFTGDRITFGQDISHSTRRANVQNTWPITPQDPSLSQHYPKFKTLEKNFLLEKNQSFFLRQKYKRKAQRQNEERFFRKQKIIPYYENQYMGKMTMTFSSLQEDSMENHDELTQNAPYGTSFFKIDNFSQKKPIIQNFVEKNQQNQWNILQKEEKTRRKNAFSLGSDSSFCRDSEQENAAEISEKIFSDSFFYDAYKNKENIQEKNRESGQKKNIESNQHPKKNKEKSLSYPSDVKKVQKKYTLEEQNLQRFSSKKTLELKKFSHESNKKKFLRPSSPAYGHRACLPVFGKISSPFGYRHHPCGGRIKMHYGIDFSAPRGTPVRSILGGVVKTIGYHRNGYGNRIEINHGNHVETFYAHLNNYSSGLYVGKIVRPGEIIGYVGSSGRTSGPHLHLEYRKNGIRRNPLELFRQEQKTFHHSQQSKTSSVLPMARRKNLQKRKKTSILTFWRKH